MLMDGRHAGREGVRNGEGLKEGKGPRGIVKDWRNCERKEGW